MTDPEPIRVLYMEDNLDLAQLVQARLERAGYLVDVALNGQMGLEMCHTTSYDVLAVDHVLPVYDGLEVIDKLASLGKLPPTIMVTGMGNEEIAVQAMKLGASDYIVKDAAGGFLDLLPSVIERVLRKQRLICEKEQALTALKAQKQLFENLVTIARVTTERPNLQATLQSTLDVSALLTGAEQGSLFLLDESGNVTQGILARGETAPREQQEIVNCVMTDGLAGWVVRQRQSALIDDVEQDARWLFLHYEPCTVRSALVVPILSADKLVGVLTLTHSTHQHFTGDHLQLMQAAADQMALALHNARMYDEQHRLADRQAVLYEVLRTVGEHLDLNQVAQVAVETIVRLIGWPSVQIFLPDETGSHLVAQAAAGSASIARGHSVSLDQGVSSRAFRTAWTQYVADVDADPDYVAGNRLIRSELAVPLRRGGQISGVLNLESDQADDFDAEDILMAESLAEALALALDNARLYTKAQQEISERLRAEQQLLLLSKALEAAANGIAITQCDGTILWVNQAFANLTGYTVQEAIGQNPRVLKSGQHKASFYQHMWETVLDGRVWRGELINRRKDGTLYTEEMTITPVRDRDGKISHFIAIKQDVTARKRAQQDLLNAKEAAEAANRAKSTFLANTSHELRTPLNAIIGYSEMLQEDLDVLGYENLVTDVTKIRAAGLRLLDMITDILDLSKVEAGKMSLQLDRFDLNALIQDVMVAVQPQIERNHNVFELRVADDLGTMYADLSKVRQILYNLLNNAAKFTQQGRITLSASRERRALDDEWLCLRVADTGIGMTAQHVRNLFCPFSQADPSTTRKYGGSGLGLAISHRFCQMLGGEISVESQVDQGSVFTVYLPMQVSPSSAGTWTVEQPPLSPQD